MLGLLDVATSEFRILELTSELSQYTGATGLAVSERYLYVVSQSSTSMTKSAPSPSSSLLIFDRRRLSLLHQYPFRCAADVHSIIAQGSTLHVISTGTDEVIQLTLREEQVVSETVFWRLEADGPREDVHHLNALYLWNDELFVSAFGKKSAVSWNSARDGFILNISRGETLTSGLDQPHSLTVVGNRLAYCESRSMAVRVIGDSRTQHLPGYTRGICAVGEHLFVATSQGRQLSKSTGVINNPASGGVPGGRCTINRLSPETFEVEQTIDLSTHASEIYDLLPVDDVAAWPLADEIMWRNASICELSNLLDQRTRWAKQSTALVAQRDATIGQLEACLKDINTVQVELAELREALKQQSADLGSLKSSMAFLDQAARCALEMWASPEMRTQLAYRQQVSDTQRTVEQVLPGQATLAVVSKGDEQLLKLGNRVAWHFPQTLEGVYAGAYPATSLAAIAQLEAMRLKGADFLLIPGASRWWLDHYKEFEEHLNRRYRELVRNEACLIFDLRQPMVSRELDARTSLLEIVKQCSSQLGYEPSVLDWNTGTKLADVLTHHTVFGPPTDEPILPYLDRSVDIVAVPQNAALLDEARRVATAAVVTVVPPVASADAPSIQVEWQMNGQRPASQAVSIIISGSPDKHQKERYLAAIECSLPRGFDGEIIFGDQFSPLRSQDSGPTDNASARNVAASHAQGEILIFLDGLTIPLDGWLPPILDFMRSNPSAGAVGGKILSADGSIHQAGGLVFSDASLAGLGREDWKTDDPLYNFVRAIDYSGDTVLATSRALFQELSGFQQGYHSSSYSHADYCFQARQRGYEICYQPESTFAAFAHQSAEPSSCSGSMNGTHDRELFTSRWRHVLKRQPFPRSWHDRDSWHALAMHRVSTTEMSR